MPAQQRPRRSGLPLSRSEPTRGRACDEIVLVCKRDVRRLSALLWYRCSQTVRVAEVRFSKLRSGFRMATRARFNRVTAVRLSNPPSGNRSLIRWQLGVAQVTGRAPLPQTHGNTRNRGSAQCESQPFASWPEHCQGGCRARAWPSSTVSDRFRESSNGGSLMMTRKLLAGAAFFLVGIGADLGERAASIEGLGHARGHYKGRHHRGGSECLTRVHRRRIERPGRTP